MSKKRVYEIAKEVGLPNREVVEKLQAMGFEVKSHSSSLEEIEADTAIKRLRGETVPEAKPKKKVAPAGVVRRRRKRTSGDTEVVTTTRIVPGQAGEEEVLDTSEARPEEPAVAAEAPVSAAGVVAPETAAEAHGASEGAESVEAEAAADGEVAVELPPVTEGEVTSVEERLTEPTATQAVVISRPLIPVAPKVPPGPRTAAGTGRRIGPVKEYQVVTDSLGRGREFVDVTKDKAGKRRTPGGVRRAKEAFSKRELLTMARERAYLPVRGRKKRPTKKGKKTEVTTAAAHKRVVRVEETIQVAELAKQMGARLTDVIRKLMQMGTPATANQSIDVETATLVAEEFEYTVEKVGLELEDLLERPEEVDEESLKPRPPVITVMGHVDHGKTSLLDYIRKAKVAAGEAGGITQHIGAYSVPVGDGTLTFIDTPGHEAFTQMRARGAQITDLVILVVAADDSIMPQTVEAINHAKAAGVPIVVAVNKCDLPQANPQRVRQGLLEHHLVPEELGGETAVVDISAKTGDGIDSLLERVLLEAEVLELTANPDVPAEGIVIEARIQKGRGPVATVLVKSGTLQQGDIAFTGVNYGKLRALTDHAGKKVKKVTPGLPVEVIGLDGVPGAGDQFYVVKDEKMARELASKNQDKTRAAGLAGDAKISKKTSLEDLFAKMKETDEDAQKELKIVLKADVQGSLEAVAAAFEKLATAAVGVTIIQKLVGTISESDVMLAAASDAIVIGFNTKPDAKAKKLAEHEGVDVRTYSVIYTAVDEVRAAMEGLLAPVRKETSVGRAEVREVFRIRGKGAVAGCSVVEGKLIRSAFVRVLRNDNAIHEGRLDGLKRFKEDVKEVANGMECGVSIANFNDVQAGDVLEVFQVEEIRASL